MKSVSLYKFIRGSGPYFLQRNCDLSLLPEDDYTVHILVHETEFFMLYCIGMKLESLTL
jgi:hypothetical protein